MSVSRRSFLGAAGIAFALFAGCVGDDGGSDGTAGGRGSTDSMGTDPAPSTAEAGRKLRVEATVNGSKYEYIESKNAVRYVAAYRHSNPSAVENGSPPTREAVYDTIPFERWARIECASVGAKRVRGFLRERLGSEMTGIAVGVTTQSGSKAIVVERSTTVNRDGEVTATPSASYERLQRIAPSAVVATVSLADRRRTCTVPVRTENTTVHLA